MSKSRKTWLASLLLVSVAIYAICFFLHRPAHDQVPSDLDFAQPFASPSPALQVLASTPSFKPLQVPLVSVLKEEARANPEMTPHSLILFSVRVGKKLQAARSNLDLAKTLLGEMKNCVLEEEAPIQAQALCLSTSRKLGAQWPELKSVVEEISDRASPGALKLESALR